MDNATQGEGMTDAMGSALAASAPTFDPAGDRPAADGQPQGLEAVFDVPVRVQAVLGRARMPISELMAMKPGFIIELDRRIGEPVDILVNNRLIARGEVVMIDNMLGVTLTEIVRQDS